MKKIAIVWGVTLILVFGSLTYLGFKYQEIKEYKELETKMVYYAKKYIKGKTDLNLKAGDKYEISLDELKVYQSKVDFSVKDDTCDGNVNVTRNFLGYFYKVNLDCKNY